MVSDIPLQTKKYFWGDDLSQLNWQDHKPYIVQTLLNKGDSESVSWLLRQTTRSDILNMLSTLNLDSKSNNFWKIYLS